MKQLRLIVFILLGITVLNFWQSCKKGPEDPFFSIHSRLARVTGEWDVTSYKVNDKDSLRRVHDSVPFFGPCGFQINKVILDYKFKWTFEKNGTYQAKLVIDSSYIFDIANNTPICKDSLYNDSSQVTTVLEWNFTSNVGDLKNKEQLYLLDPETQKMLLFNIIELRNNEMKLQRDTIDPVTNEALQKAYTLTRIK